MPPCLRKTSIQRTVRLKIEDRYVWSVWREYSAIISLFRRLTVQLSMKSAFITLLLSISIEMSIRLLSSSSRECWPRSTSLTSGLARLSKGISGAQSGVSLVSLDTLVTRIWGREWLQSGNILVCLPWEDFPLSTLDCQSLKSGRTPPPPPASSRAGYCSRSLRRWSQWWRRFWSYYLPGTGLSSSQLHPRRCTLGLNILLLPGNIAVSII